MMRQLISDVVRWLMSLTMQEWFLMFVGVVVIGAVWLRGYGSRNEY